MLTLLVIAALAATWTGDTPEEAGGTMWFTGRVVSSPPRNKVTTSETETMSIDSVLLDVITTDELDVMKKRGGGWLLWSQTQGRWVVMWPNKDKKGDRERQ